jgi:hypothetical protein
MALATYSYCHVLGCVTRWGMSWILDLLTTWTHHWEPYFTDHSDTDYYTRSITISTSRFLATDLTQWGFFSFPRLGTFVTADRAELLLTDNSNNWVPGSLPFHIDLLVLYGCNSTWQLVSLLKPTRFKCVKFVLVLETTTLSFQSMQLTVDRNIKICLPLPQITS